MPLKEPKKKPDGTTEVLAYFKATVTEKEFRRGCYIALSDLPDTPIDILTSQFDDVSMYIDEYCKINIDVDAEWSAFVGNDRTENYIEYVKQLDIVNGKVQSRQEPKSMTKIVTDYHPMSGSFSFNTNVVIHIDDATPTMDRLSFLLDDKIEMFSLEDNEVEGIAVNPDKPMTAIQIQTAQDMLFNTIYEKWAEQAPGDRHKDFNSNARFSNQADLRCFIPSFELKYHYKDSECSAKSTAAKLEIHSHAPHDNSHCAAGEKKAQLFKKINMASWIAFAALILGALLSSTILPLSSALFLLALFVVLPVSIYLRPFYKKKVKEFSSIAFFEAQKEKRKRLNAFLSNHGMNAHSGPLNIYSMHLSSFDENLLKKLNEEYSEAEKSTGYNQINSASQY